jgi:hypothetical protein
LALIKTAWEKKARTRYVDKLTKLKGKGKMPAYMDQDVWDAWTAEWQGESSKKKSEQTRRNRLGEIGQPSKHMGGSVSYNTHAERLLQDFEDIQPPLSSSVIPILVSTTRLLSSMIAL